jgi:hypothetical protein
VKEIEIEVETTKIEEENKQIELRNSGDRDTLNLTGWREQEGTVSFR